MASKNDPIPAIPPETRIPLFTVTSTSAGHTNVPTARTFYYAGIQSIWIWWLVDLKVLTKAVSRFKMKPYDFGGRGAVNINFFNAAAMYGSGQPGNMGIGGFNETEVNVVAYASKVAPHVPQGISLEDFLAHGEPTKRVGNMRLWVACDDPVAVAAGQQVFFENKFLTPYTYSVPAFNNPSQRTYDWQCHDPKDSSLLIYEASVDLAGLTPTPVPGNGSEIIDLSYDRASRRPVGSRRNYLGLYTTYPLPRGSKAVTLSMGKSTHKMGRDMRTLIGSLKPKVIQTFVSPPCIAEAAGYYADV